MVWNWRRHHHCSMKSNEVECAVAVQVSREVGRVKRRTLVLQTLSQNYCSSLHRSSLCLVDIADDDQFNTMVLKRARRQLLHPRRQLLHRDTTNSSPSSLHNNPIGNHVIATWRDRLDYCLLTEEEALMDIISDRRQSRMGAGADIMNNKRRSTAAAVVE